MSTQQVPINSSDQNSSSNYLPYYVSNNNQNFLQPNGQQNYSINESNNNVIHQPLLDFNDSIDYTESFSEMSARTNENQNDECHMSPGFKIFLIIEIIADVIGLIAYFIIF